MSTATFAWKGLNDPHRFDITRADFESEMCRASGASVTRDYELPWQLDVADGWRTRCLTVERRSRSGAHTRLTLERAPSGAWSGDRTEIDTARMSRRATGASPAALGGPPAAQQVTMPTQDRIGGYHKT